MKQKEVSRISILSRLIILDCINYIYEGGVEMYKLSAIENLKELAKCYNIPLSKRGIVYGTLKQRFKEFVSNEKGYIETLQNLYAHLSR